MIEEAARKYAGRIKFVRIDHDEEWALGLRLGVKSVPSYRLWIPGQEPVDLGHGFEDEAAFHEFLDRAVAESVPAGAKAPAAWALPSDIPAPGAAADAKGKDQLDPQALVNDAWQAIHDYFLWQDRLDVCDKWKQSFGGAITSWGRAERAIARMIKSLDDDYSSFLKPEETSEHDAGFDEHGVVTHRLLPGGIGYVQVGNLESLHAFPEAVAALTDLVAAPGYILDLRRNEGGSAYEAWKVFALFAESGAFTSMKGRFAGKPHLEELSVDVSSLQKTVNGASTSTARPARLTAGKPVVVLIDQDTASAAEMLAGALRDHKLATLIGTTTAGKGVGQVGLKLDGGYSLLLTYAQYFLPGGDSIQEKGIAPDVQVAQKSGTDSQLEAAIALLKGKP